MSVSTSNLWPLVTTSLHVQMPELPPPSLRKRKCLLTHLAVKIPVIIIDRYEDLQPRLPPLTHVR